MTTLYPWTRLTSLQCLALGPTGIPIPGAKLFFYASGTATPLDTFADADHTVPNLNPVVADDITGRFPDIFLQELEYKVVWTDSNDVEIDTFDPVAPFVDNDPTPNSYYDLSVWFGSKPAAGEIYEFNVVRPLMLPNGFTGSIYRCDASTKPTNDATVIVSKNGVQINTINWSAGTAIGFANGTGVQNFVAADVFQLTFPTPQDTTFSLVSFTFLFTVV